MNNISVSHRHVAENIQTAVDPKPVKLLLVILTVWVAVASPVFGVDADLSVTSFSNFLPSTITAGSRPTNITYSLVNFGPGSLGNNFGGTGPVLIELWISPNTSFGDGDDRYLGQMQFSISAPAGSSGTYSHSNPNGFSGFTIPLDAAGAYRVFIRVLPAPSSGITDPTWANNLNLLPGALTVSGGGISRPTVASIIRWNPPFQTNNAQFVTWLVNFSETVTSVDLNDFTLVDVDGTVANEFLGNVSAGGGSQIQVTANTGIGGAGDLRLDVNYPGATITGLSGNTLTNSFNGGQVYTVDKVVPTVTFITRLDPPGQITSAPAVVYRVTFSEPVIGVTVDDFMLIDVSETITGESITSVSAFSGTIIDVTVNTGSNGNGDLRLDVIVPGATIADASLNSMNSSFNVGQIYKIERATEPRNVAIADTSITERQTGMVPCLFQVRLNSSSAVPVSVSFTTANGTATIADNDYVPTNGIITFAPGESEKSITVLVNGDTQIEPDETFLVMLSNATNAAISASQAVGTILNDDAPTLPSELAAIDVSWETTPTSAKHNDATAGWEFRVFSPIKVIKLGLFDASQDGFQQSHQVGLWTTNGTLLVQTNFTSGATAELVDGFRYLPVTETILQPGHYIIGAFFVHAGPDRILDNPAFATTAPQIAFYQPRYGAQPSLSFPNIGQGVGNGTNTFGPNFLFVEFKPAMTVSLTLTNVQIAWPNSTIGFRLEATTNLSPSDSWSPITNSPTQIGDQYQLTLPRVSGNQFFRLVNP